MPRPTTLAYAALAAVDACLAASAGPAHRLRVGTKSALMPLLALDTALATAGRPSGLVRGVRAAQLFSWAGDVALQASSSRCFLVGLGSFLAGHVSYIAAFASARDPRNGCCGTGEVGAAATWLAVAPAMAVLARRREPALALPVAGYAAVLCAMFASSTTLDRSLPPAARGEVAAGSALFLLSDTMLGIGKFAGRGGQGALDVAVMATYTAGQWLIADGAARTL